VLFDSVSFPDLKGGAKRSLVAERHGFVLEKRRGGQETGRPTAGFCLSRQRTRARLRRANKMLRQAATRLLARGVGSSGASFAPVASGAGHVGFASASGSNKAQAKPVAEGVGMVSQVRQRTGSGRSGGMSGALASAPPRSLLLPPG